MIKFFRKIRRKLLVEGNTGRYFQYAVGEIILVVIGILIALQINNWNADRIQRQKESIYLQNIERDVKEQLKTIDSQIAYEQSVAEVATPIIKHYKTHQSFLVDSAFTSHIGILTGRVTFVRNAPTYTELISSGNIDIIKNDALKDDIIRYYQELERAELIINKNNNLYTDAVFIPKALGLSEIQMIGELGLDILKDFASSDDLPFIDLNEDRLKEITKAQLAIPENELTFINSINYRNFLSLLHVHMLKNKRKHTEALLENLRSN